MTPTTTLFRLLVEAPLAAHPTSSERIREPGWVTVCNGDQEPSGNEILWSAGGDPEQLLRRARQFFPGRFKWAVVDGVSPPGLLPLLCVEGFEIWTAAAMTIAPDALLPVVDGATAPIEVQRVSCQSSEFEAFVDCYLRGWAVSEQRGHWRALMSDRGDAHWQHFLARHALTGEALGTASTVTPAGADYGYLFGAQVIAEHRRQGAYRALLEARLRDLSQCGRTTAVTLARAATSAPLLARWGFTTLTEYRIAQAP